LSTIIDNSPQKGCYFKRFDSVTKYVNNHNMRRIDHSPSWNE